MFSIKEARDQVEATLRTAWSFDTDDRVIVGEPDQNETTRKPYAVISSTLSREFTGVRNVTETATFTISGHFEKENGQIIEDLKNEKQGLLGDALVVVDWESLGYYMPTVSGSEDPDTDLATGEYIASVTFSLMTDIAQ